MNFNEFMQPQTLVRNSFVWSQARLIVAAVALLLGAVPPALFVFGRIPGLYGLVSSLVTLAWIISGAASAYLLYRWNAAGRKVFGGTAQKDTIAFFVSVVSGLNLGITGLIGINIGMRSRVCIRFSSSWRYCISRPNSICRSAGIHPARNFSNRPNLTAYA